MARFLKINWNDQLSNTIDGIQRVSDSEVDTYLIPRILEEFSKIDGTGHLDLSSGDVIGTYTNTFWPKDVGGSLDYNVVSYGFEDNTPQGWVFDETDFGIRTDRKRGSYSIGINKDSAAQQLAHIDPAELDGGRQIEKASFFYQENSFSHGAGFRFYDSSGNVILGVATDNPEWAIEDSNGVGRVSLSQSTSSPSYDVWYQVEVQFDWSAGEATVTWLDSGGTILESYPNRPLLFNTDVERFSLENYNSGAFQSSDAYIWYDDFSFVYYAPYFPDRKSVV